MKLFYNLHFNWNVQCQQQAALECNLIPKVHAMQLPLSSCLFMNFYENVVTVQLTEECV